MGLVPEIQNMLIYDELNYDIQSLANEHRKLMSRMTVEQRSIYEQIMKRVDEKRSSLFFLYGYGGTGKTYIRRAMFAALRSRGEIVLTVTSSGIAALLILGGRTAHSRFAIPINIHEASTCEILPTYDLANLIHRAMLIIWDEAPMMHKHCFEAVDRTLKDILREKNFPFGGKVVVLCGDFRQILPVIPKGTRQEVVNSTINSSHLWRFCEVLTLTTNMKLLTGSSDSDVEERKNFSEWILGIGDGSIGQSNDADIIIHIPQDLLIPSLGDPLSSIVQNTYPDLLNNMNYPSFFQDRAILAPKNTIVSSGILNHKLRLKVGVPVMLLRKLNNL